MSIVSEVSRIITAKAAIAGAIKNKGVIVPSNATLDKYAALLGMQFATLEGSYSAGTQKVFQNLAFKPRMVCGYTQFASGAFRHFYMIDQTNLSPCAGSGKGQGSNDSQVKNKSFTVTGSNPPYTLSFEPNGTAGTVSCIAIG